MHRKAKRLLTLILTLAMVAACAIPAWAKEQSVEQQPGGAASVSSSDADNLYDSLTEEQKQFRVYAGTDISSDLTFMDDGIAPDSANLDAQGGSIIKTLLESRKGDLKFYKLSGWNVWKVDSNGKPESIWMASTSALLSKAATEKNFKQSAYLENSQTAAVICQKPILEPVWSCLDYTIPVYDINGNDTGATITINAENYGDGSQVAFPDVGAYSWKLIYNGTECPLHSESEIWTNEINGIRTIGINFDTSQARVQAVAPHTVLQPGNAEFIQPDWHEGQPKPAPIVSSATNGEKNITYYYKKAGADDSAYTTAVPDKAGKYTAKAVFAATEFYQEVIRTSEFEILPYAVADKTAPVISGVASGETYYGEHTVTVTDENLCTVTVNGEAAEVSNNRADITLMPSEDEYIIIAEDSAGNRTEYTVKIWETWVRDGITKNGIKNLRRERIYRLGGGEWTIDGDSTVYSGGITFYIKNSGEYNFTHK